jgi:hypothetical protein
MSEFASEELPSDLRAFLYSCIDSVEQVEILVLLCRSKRAWTAAATAAHLSMTDAAARNHLETLAARGLLQIAVATEVSYTYAPRSAPLREYAERLADSYTSSRLAIVRFIAANPRRMKRFSDAFKLREPE